MSGASTVTGTASSSIERLLDAMERLPSQGNVALQVLWMADDPTTSLTDLARAVEADPVLVARLLHLANSAYYSPRQPITTVERAIMLLGFATVRTIATVVACGLGPGAVPTGFWPHASAAATAAQLVAWRFGINSGEAFATGLLHDLGRGLLYLADPDLYAELGRQLLQRRESGPGAGAWSPPADRLQLERSLFGVTHPEAAARVLRAWSFPTSMVEAISHHHAPLDGAATSDATQLLIAAEAITELAMGSWDEPVQTDAALALLQLEPDRLELIVRRVRNESTGLSTVLSI